MTHNFRLNKAVRVISYYMITANAVVVFSLPYVQRWLSVSKETLFPVALGFGVFNVGLVIGAIIITEYERWVHYRHNTRNRNP